MRPESLLLAGIEILRYAQNDMNSKSYIKFNVALRGN